MAMNTLSNHSLSRVLNVAKGEYQVRVKRARAITIENERYLYMKWPTGPRRPKALYLYRKSALTKQNGDG